MGVVPSHRQRWQSNRKRKIALSPESFQLFYAPPCPEVFRPRGKLLLRSLSPVRPPADKPPRRPYRRAAARIRNNLARGDAALCLPVCLPACLHLPRLFNSPANERRLKRVPQTHFNLIIDIKRQVRGGGRVREVGRRLRFVANEI